MEREAAHSDAETAASAKVAIRSCAASALRTIFAATAAPLPSPSRMSSDSKGSSPSSASSRRCPGSAEQWPALQRSEEHTSELQSLMRISYAVFCLKKKKKQQYDKQDTIVNSSRTL